MQLLHNYFNIVIFYLLSYFLLSHLSIACLSCFLFSWIRLCSFIPFVLIHKFLVFMYVLVNDFVFHGFCSCNSMCPSCFVLIPQFSYLLFVSSYHISLVLNSGLSFLLLFQIPLPVIPLAILHSPVFYSFPQIYKNECQPK